MGGNRSVDDVKKAEFLAACENEEAFLQLMQNDPVGVSTQISQIRNNYILRNADKTGFNPETDSYQFPAPFLEFSTKQIISYLKKDGTELLALFGESDSPAGNRLQAINELKPIYEPILEKIAKQLEEASKHNYPYQQTLEAIIEYANVIAIINGYKLLKTHVINDPDLGSKINETYNIRNGYPINTPFSKFFIDKENIEDFLSKMWNHISENSREYLEKRLFQICSQISSLDYNADLPGIFTGIEIMGNARNIIFGQASSSETISRPYNNLSSIDNLIFVPQFSELNLSFFNKIRPGNVYTMGLLSPSIGYAIADDVHMAAHTFATHDIVHAIDQAQLPKTEHGLPSDELGHTDQMRLGEKVKNNLYKLLNEKILDPYRDFNEQAFQQIKSGVIENKDDALNLSHKLAKFGLSLDEATKLAADCDSLNDFNSHVSTHVRTHGSKYYELLLFVLLHEIALNYLNINSDAFINNHSDESGYSFRIPEDFDELLSSILDELKLPAELIQFAKGDLQSLLSVLHDNNRENRDETAVNTESMTRQNAGANNVVDEQNKRENPKGLSGTEASFFQQTPEGPQAAARSISHSALTPSKK